MCLKGSHLAKDFSSKIKFFKCSNRHDAALCDLEESGHSNSSSVTNIAGVDDHTNILLQTVKVKVKNSENSYVNSAQFLFEITPQLRNRLKLKTVGTRKISVQTFGNNCSGNIFEKVNLCILALDGSDICVISFVKKNCALLNNQNINLAKETFPHIRNILLADSNPNNERLSIDILIGAAYYKSYKN